MNYYSGPVQIYNIYYHGEFYGEATLAADYAAAQKGACDLLEQSVDDVNPAFVQAVRVK